jgi:hypothetical protein
MRSIEARGRRPDMFTSLVIVITLVTGVLAVITFGRFISSAVDFFPLDDRNATGAATRPVDAWCRSEGPYRPFVRLIDEATIGGRTFAGRARSFALTHLVLVDEEARYPTSVRADFAVVKSAVTSAAQAAATPAPLRPDKARTARTAAGRLDHVCTSAGA